ncbi:molybdopterin cofactor-binding domain-containing protein [Eleftheria terrae]|uniref:xanthine dehydrogenase family protein molybdopterin-binding subunit n=1 Tax=Eleftheria terrae TaxID=1597781 RepID=UPI003F4E20D9
MSYERLMTRVGAASTSGRAASSDALPRRAFLKLAAGSGFALGCFPALAAEPPSSTASLPPERQPSAFLRVEPDGSVVVQVNRLDFGQGVQTALPMLVAEELDADWSQVRGELAPAGDAYKDPNFHLQMTGGSNSVRSSWNQYRELGARARAMFVAAAAQRWSVPASQVQVRDGVVTAAGQQATFGELAQDAMRQPVPQAVTLKAPQDFRLLGRPTPRLDAAAKSSGRQVFGMDYKPPGCKVVVIARPPVFGARLARLDATAARAVRGVVEVLKVPLDRGASGVAVVADGYWPARQGREALQLEWDSSGVEKVDTDRLLARYRELARQPGMKAREADLSRLAEAPRRITAEYSFPYLAHAPMEPLNCVIELQERGCKVWAGSQFQTVDQAAVAAALGLKVGQVELVTMMAGGGFGRRAVPTSDYLVEAAHVARAWQAAGHRGPLKLIWSREDDLRGGYYRPMHVHRADIGFDASGRVLGWKHTIVGQSLVTGTPFEAFMVKNGVDSVAVEGVVDTPYDLPLALEVHHPQVNVPVLWWRSVGHTHTAYVMETLVDEIAHASGQDPVAYRRRLWGGRHPRHLAALELAVQRSGYGKRRLPAGRAWGVAVHESFGSVVAWVVEASMREGQPVLHRATAGVHCNFAVNPLTVEAQVQGAALMALGTTLPGAAITLKDGVVQQGNFSDYTVPRLPQMPEVAVHIVPSADAPTGIGEPGLPPLAPAFANALATLTGRRLRDLPFATA